MESTRNARTEILRESIEMKTVVGDCLRSMRRRSENATDRKKKRKKKKKIKNEEKEKQKEEEEEERKQI